MTGDQWQGMAAFVVAIGSLAGSIGTLAMQFRNNKVSRANASKLDEQGVKIDEVHRSTAAFIEATGTHKMLTDGQPPAAG